MTTSAPTVTILIAGGGTGGHIYPALAIAAALAEALPGVRPVFVGTRYGLERDIVTRAGWPIEYLAVRGLVGKSVAARVAGVARLGWSAIQALMLVARHRPAAVAGVGGYASGPAVAMARLCGVPTLILESNAHPGLTNRLLSRWASAIAVAFPRANERLARPGRVTGNPVRREFFAIADKTETGRRLLVFGGSQGSRFLNELVVAAAPALAALGIAVVHQTGRGEHERVVAAYRAAGAALVDRQPAAGTVQVVPYLEEIYREYERADLVVCRAGALTVSELNAAGRPALLVPFAAATHNHQEENARVQEAAGAARVLTEREASGEKLAAVVGELFQIPGALARMAAASRALARPHAARDIAGMLMAVAGLAAAPAAGTV